MWPPAGRHTERASRIAASSATRQNYVCALPFEVGIAHRLGDLHVYS
jgi:hypothetical protein